MAKITPKLKPGDIGYAKQGYVRILMRWRENGDHWGAAPPATESMVKEGAAFSLKKKAAQSGMLGRVWEAHVKHMRTTFEFTYLKQFHLDYLTLKEWEKA